MINPSSPDYSTTPLDNLVTRHIHSVNDNFLPVVTIITPVYNSGSFIGELADCIFNQSFPFWEWIIVNDCSNDQATLGILSHLEAFDSRLKIIDVDKNMGPASTRNRGAKQAQTEYLFFCDGDDLLENTIIEKFLLFLLAHQNFSFVSSYHVGFGDVEYLSTAGFYEGERFLIENRSPMTSMIKKQVYLSLGGQDESNRQGLEDWDFWLKAAANGLWGGTVPEFLLWYRRKSGFSAKWPNWDEGERQAEFLLNLTKKYPFLYKNGIPIVSDRCLSTENFKENLNDISQLWKNILISKTEPIGLILGSPSPQYISQVSKQYSQVFVPKNIANADFTEVINEYLSISRDVLKLTE